MSSVMNETIADALNKSKNLIESDRADEALRVIGEMINVNPEFADERFKAELGLLERLIFCRKALKDSEYVRSFELVSKYCKQIYSHGKHLEYQKLSNEFLPDRDKIWWFWDQGLDKAPDIVKACYKSLCRLEKEVVILDADNISEYVDLPGHIVDIYTKGGFSTTHFSDILRLALLTSRGGMWVDSTVYFTSPDTINDIIASSDYFAYRAIRSDNISRYATYDSWLIYASKPSYILEDTKKMLFEYWIKENTLQHYFLFHILMNIACERHRDEESLIQIFSSEPCHILQMEMMKPYNEHRYAQIKAMSGIHKLTYKYDTDKSIHGTFLEKVIKDIPEDHI